MVLAHIINVVRVWQRYQACVSQLNLLNDRELADLGLTRSNLHRIAWHAAQDVLAGSTT